MNKKVILSLLIIVAIAIGVYKYIYQEHRDINAEKPDHVTTALIISYEFSNNPLESETKYLNKTIEISGKVSEKNKNDLTIDDNVFCKFKDSINYPITQNSTVKVKGRCIGYDDLLEQVKLDQCNIITD